MKILLYVNSYLPRVGGREVVVHQLAKSYQELGHEVRVAGPGSWWKFRKTKFSYPVHRLANIPLLPEEWVWQIHLIFIKFVYKFDIIHAHSTYPNGYTAAKVRKIIKCPLIITPHGEDIHIVPEIGFGLRLDPEQDKKIRYALQFADYTTAISDSVAQSTRDAGMPDEKIVQIPNGVDLLRFQRKQKIDVYKYLDIPDNSQVVLSIGNYHPRKGHEVLIKAVKEAVTRNSRIRLIIVGKLSEDLVEKVKTDGFSDFIKFTGSLKFPVDQVNNEPDILVAIMQEAEVYVTASIDEGSEGLSLALLEAMSSGLCVIATDISGNRDIIKNGINGIIVPPSSSQLLSNALIDVLDNDDFRQSLKIKSIETANKYGWLDVAKQYISLYEKTLTKSR